jgi:hypothetical protein
MLYLLFAYVRNCARAVHKTLRTARNAYQEGKLDVLPALLTPCKAGISKKKLKL